MIFVIKRVRIIYMYLHFCNLSFCNAFVKKTNSDTKSVHIMISLLRGIAFSAFTSSEMSLVRKEILHACACVCMCMLVRIRCILGYGYADL